ncbi:hypothetical protein E4U21_006225 [Claviceps maximensis]|nr:hypothetical protein E4U21_006225 [Claviceps maximensis]
MLPKRSSDSPPPRPAHLVSVEENIANLRRCSPESVYNLVHFHHPDSHSSRPSSRSSSVYSSDEESIGAPPNEHDDAVDVSESIEASLLEWSNSVPSCDLNARDIDQQKQQHHHEDDASISRMSLGSIETPDCTSGTRHSESFDHDDYRSLIVVEDAEAATTQDDSRGSRNTEQQDGHVYHLEMEPPREKDADIVAQALDVDTSRPRDACRLCCRPALSATNVCTVHRMAETEKPQGVGMAMGLEKAQQVLDMEIAAYYDFREGQLTEKYAEEKSLETQIHDMESRRVGGNMGRGKSTRQMRRQIRDMRRELEKRRQQIRGWEMEKEREEGMKGKFDLGHWQIPSRSPIIRVYHGKSAWNSGRDPTRQNILYSKRCGCPDYRPLPLESTHV